MSPARYEPWEAAYSVFRRCQINGTWACVLGELRVEADADGVIVGGSARPDGLPGASACRRCPQKGDHDPGWTCANYLAAEPYDRALGRSRGGLSTKLHLAVAGSGHVLAVTVTGGQRGGAPQFTRLVDRIRVARTSGGRTHTRPSRVIADPACSSRVIRACLRRLQIPHTIPGNRNWAGHRLRQARQVVARPALTASSASAGKKSGAGSGCSSRRAAVSSAVPCRYHVAFGGSYSSPSRLFIVSSVGQGGPSCNACRNSSPKRLPFGNWSPSSQRHAATIARTSCRHSSSSSWSMLG